MLLDPVEPCDICQHTSSRPLFAGLLVTPRNKDDMGDGVPTDQLSLNLCDCTDSHCNSLIVLRVCLCFLLSHLLSQVHRRQKQMSDFVETKKYWTLPKSCGGQSLVGGAQEEQGQERLALQSRKTVTLMLFYLLFFFSPIVIRQSLRRPVDGCGGARSRTMQVRMYCSISCLVRHVSRKIFSFACCVCENFLISLLLTCRTIRRIRRKFLRVPSLVFLLSIPWPSFSLPHEAICVAMFDRCAWCT